MSVLVATAYMEEAGRFDWLVAMDSGRLLATGTPAELRARTGADTLEAAFIGLLPEERRRGHRAVTLPPLAADADAEVAIEARDLTRRFGDFTAVDRVSFRIRRGEIFGFLGSNGCGKTTTMKMLTGLLPASAGEARLFGHAVDPHDIAGRRRVGYMSQSFSLYSELTVEQNLVLHARLFRVADGEIPARVTEMVERFGLAGQLDRLPTTLPLGQRQRLSLAVAMIHRPELLILDEPTSGVDPIARDTFWQLMIDLARRDRVTIFISTHFMNEAERCDRISLMHAGRVLVSDTPVALQRQQQAATLEEAFIAFLEEADAQDEAGLPTVQRPPPAPVDGDAPRPRASASARRFSPGRAFSYTLREALELGRDPVRLTLALLGTVILLFIMGFGISMDVEDLRFAVLDRDQSGLSRNYTLSLAGSRYFVERPPITDYAQLDDRMQSGELSLAIEIPSGFGRDLERGRPVAIAAWIDGAMPQRAETVRGYVQGMHHHWLLDTARSRLGRTQAAAATVETRFRYNPDVKSLPAMVPAVIPLLLLMIPAMLTALSVVREKEMGSIINLYVTPVRRSEFLLGKQLPYLVLAMGNFLLLTALAVTVFGVPMTGSFAALFLATLLYTLFATGFGLFASVFTRSQIAAIFATMVGTILPVVQFAGLINPVSSLAGAGRLIGEVYPATHMLIISRGVFSKALGVADLGVQFAALLAAVPVIFVLAVLLLDRQER